VTQRAGAAITSVQLRSCGLSGAVLEFVAPLLASKSLSLLDLSGNALGDAAAARFFGMLPDSWVELVADAGSMECTVGLRRLGGVLLCKQTFRASRRRPGIQFSIPGIQVLQGLCDRAGSEAASLTMLLRPLRDAYDSEMDARRVAATSASPIESSETDSDALRKLYSPGYSGPAARRSVKKPRSPSKIIENLCKGFAVNNGFAQRISCTLGWRDLSLSSVQAFDSRRVLQCDAKPPGLQGVVHPEFEYTVRADVIGQGIGPYPENIEQILVDHKYYDRSLPASTAEAREAAATEAEARDIKLGAEKPGEWWGQFWMWYLGNFPDNWVGPLVGLSEVDGHGEDLSGYLTME